jgi:hypothetical protein
LPKYEDAMPTTAKLFVAFTIAAGSAVVLATLAGGHSLPDPSLFLYCLTLGLLASTFKIKLPGMQSTIGASFVLFLVALTELTFMETLIIVVLSTLLQCLWRPKKQPKMIQVAFSIASTIISVEMAFQATAALRQEAVVAALVVASAVFFAVNSGMVSLVVALVNSQAPMDVWRNCHRWAFPYYLLGAGLAVGVTAYGRTYGWSLAFTMLPLLYMVYACYSQWLKPQLAESNSR